MTDQWKTSLPLAVGLHFLVAAAALLSPMFIARKPLLPEIYTVDLFTVSDLRTPEPAPAAAPRKAPAARPKTIAPTTPAKRKISIAPPTPIAPPAPAVSTAPAKVISIAPIKTKIKLKRKAAAPPVSTKGKKKLARAFEDLQTRIKEKKAQEELDRLRKEAQMELEQLKKEAVDKIRETYKEVPPSTTVTVTPPRPSPLPAPSTAAIPVKSVFSDSRGISGKTGNGAGNSGGSSSGSNLSGALKQYYAQVQGRIKEHWVLPEMQNWDNSLEAILVLKIRRDGTVIKTFFDKKSSNVYFNQFVLKAVREAMPLPPFPPQMKEKSKEIGFRFTPDSLY